MVGVINEPTTNKTLAAFAAAAAKAGNSTSPSGVWGGVLTANTAASNSSASSSASATATNVYGTSSSAPAPTAKTNGAVAMQAMRWSELLGMGVVIGGAALLTQ
jgi:hypothetical protein